MRGNRARREASSSRGIDVIARTTRRYVSRTLNALDVDAGDDDDAILIEIGEINLLNLRLRMARASVARAHGVVLGGGGVRPRRGG